MPEYLAPGVYVEEVSYRSKSIEGVSTTTTGFVGPTAYGPFDKEPDVITSLNEFELLYGGGQQLTYVTVEEKDGNIKGSYGAPGHNYMWHAARAFFNEGGRRLYVARAFRPLSDKTSSVPLGDGTTLSADGRARKAIPTNTQDEQALHLTARFPGAAGNLLRIRFTAEVGQNILAIEPSKADSSKKQWRVRPLSDRDLVLITRSSGSGESKTKSNDLYLAHASYDTTTQETVWSFEGATATDKLELTQLKEGDGQHEGDTVRIVTVGVEVTRPDGGIAAWGGLALDPQHRRFGELDSLTSLFEANPPSRLLERTLPIVIEPGKELKKKDGLAIFGALFGDKDAPLFKQLIDPRSSAPSRTVEHMLTGGNDGQRPDLGAYEGRAEEDEQVKTGLKALEDVEDIAIIAAPGSTFDYQNDQNTANAVINALIGHAMRMRYRIAVIDCGDGQTIADVREMRGRLDSKYAAFYYPWVRILDPITNVEIALPPSGFVAGIYARNDITRAVYKAPANEVVNSAIGFERLLNSAQQDVLNPEGINCFRFFEGRGFRLWGARTLSSDPEWKYVNVRRYFAYLERSIDRGTQWAVFEPNGEALWANVRRTIEDFLLNEWQSGALLGDKPEKAYFVRCDRSTMTQNDLDNGRLICQIGVAPLRPAEFVVFRIGQWTADARK